MNRYISVMFDTPLKLALLLVVIAGNVFIITEAEAVRLRPIIKLVPEYARSFDRRNGSAKAVNMTEVQLEQQGYIKVGDLAVGQILKDCYQKDCKKKKCKDFRYSKTTAQVLKKIAGKNGADVVVFSKKDFKGSAQSYGRGRCRRMVDNQGARVGMRWDTERELYINNWCRNFYYGDINQEYRKSEATIWRKDKKLRKKIDRDFAFFEAIVMGDYDEVKKFLHQGMPLNKHDLYGRFPINLAILNRRDALLKFFLHQGASIDVHLAFKRPRPIYVMPNEEHWMRFRLKPVHFAAMKGTLKTVKLLMRRGASLSEKNKIGLMPLHIVNANPDSSVLRFILQKVDKSRINSKSRSGETPLMFAVYSGRPEYVRLFIKAGANVNARRGRLAGLARMLGARTPTALDIAYERKTQYDSKNVEGLISDYAGIIRILKKAGAKRSPPRKRRRAGKRRRKSC
ncbi:MAG TPA: ankyrin repeat domain-containing protein [Acidiferrobacteraceae bacterium]|nr:ankyrin repeat domain-containing protein [Acidiferrobacteraceae bacterium]HEX19288.1 ankyrin repeat domain-containing protein [Acidiferrobacteraceae bacterium]